ncbi:MAG: FlgD immunoglobulin-like domain containing protein [Candidatus Eisenbacteria bacterium]
MRRCSLGTCVPGGMRRTIRNCSFSAAVVFCLFTATAAAAGGTPARSPEGPLTLVLLSTDSPAECRAVQEAVYREGGRVRMVFLPSVIVAFLPEESASRLTALGPVVDARRGPVDPSAYGRLTRDQSAGLAIWNDHFMGLKQHDEQLLRRGEPGPGRHYSCGIPVPLEFRDPGLGVPGKKGYVAGFFSTSEYMILDGGTSDHLEFQLNIVFPESNGLIDASTENWTNADMSNYITEVYEGIEWWADRYGPARMTMALATTWDVDIPWEPINHAHTFESTWADDLMDSLNSGGSSYFNKVRNFDNNYLVWEKTCWTNTLFVVNSKNDADGNFTDGWFDYSYLGGPFMVMTYDNGWRGNGNTDYMCAHETGHTWYALDEYASTNPPCTDTETSGYLNVPNGNCENGGGISVECIMRNNVRDEFTNGSVCSYTRDAVGWRDTDADSIPDIVDHPPILTLTGFAATPTCDSTPTFTGSVIPEREPNRNPARFSSGSSSGDTISVNSVSLVEYRVNGGAWQSATPTDGEWDEADEAFQFTPVLAAQEISVVEARARNSRGLYSAIRRDTLIYMGGFAWSDGFEDGSASDWTIVNGGATIALTNTTAHGGTWSIQVTGASGASQGATAESPALAPYIDTNEPYTVSFWFRYGDFHWDQFVVFGHVRILVDYPWFPIKYDPVGNWTGLTNLGGAFNGYIPANTWKKVEIAVNPGARQYTVTMGGSLLGTATYNTTVVPSSRLWFADNYSASNFMNGWYDDFRVAGCPTATGVPMAGVVQGAAFRLFASPNPFGPAADVRCELPASAHVALQVYDVSGRLVRTLLDEEQAAGVRVVPWDGRDSRGQRVSAGVYFVRMQAGHVERHTKVVLMR